MLTTSNGTPSLAIEATGLVKTFGDDPRRRRRRPRRARAAPSTACSAPTAPARRRRSACSRRCCAPTPAAPACSATTSSPRPTRCAALVSLTGQLASVDEDLTGRENLILLGAPARLPAGAGQGAGRRAARGVRARGGRRAGSSSTTPAACAGGSTSPRASSSRRELMFLDEPTTGLDPRSRNQVWDIVRALVAAGHDGAAVHAVPRRGRPARRPDRRHRPRQGDRRGHAGASSRRRSAAARCTCACSTRRSAPRPSACSRGALDAEVHLEADPGRAVGAGARRRAGRRRRSPSCRATAIALAGFSLGQPSLDEVFLALTGHSAEERKPRRRRAPRPRSRRHEHRPGHPLARRARGPATALHAALSSTARPPRPERRCRPA